MFPDITAEVEALNYFSTTTSTSSPEFDWVELQETFSAIGHALQEKKNKERQNYQFRPLRSNDHLTSSSYNEDMNFDLPIIPHFSADQGVQTSRWTKNAVNDYDTMSKICSSEQLYQLKTVLNAIFINISSKLYDLIVKIPLDIDLNEDDFISVDWTFKNLSIGFTLESDPKISGWWASSNDKAGNLLLAGMMSDNEMIDEKVKYCLQLVLDNYEGLMA